MAGATRASRSARENKIRALPSRNGAVREPFADLQRARILSAMFEVVCERGATSVSVANVVERSGVSRRTFYEEFTDREDCFIAAFEQALSYATERVLPAYRSQRGWRERIRAALIALLSFLEEEPQVGRVLICESLAGGPRTLERRAHVFARLTHTIDEVRQEGRAASPPPLTAEGLAGGILTVLHSRLTAMGGTPLLELVNPLMSTIVLPYLGPAAARRELERPAPISATGAQRESPALLSDPFKQAGMRLTYRTVLVLMAIADRPGASNRVIGETAGMSDQGQVSKLLGRLARTGLVQNTGLGPGTGAPNVWTLTSSGQQVTQGIRKHTEDLT
jgi:AcrR family transcriptional regulator/DNA-binding MarR family transcriptional regulator